MTAKKSAELELGTKVVISAPITIPVGPGGSWAPLKTYEAGELLVEDQAELERLLKYSPIVELAK